MTKKVLTDREKAVRNALGTMAVAGFYPNEEQKELFRKLAAGEIEEQDVLDYTFQKIEKWRKEKPECFYSKDEQNE